MALPRKQFAVDKVETRRLKPFPSPGQDGGICYECWRVAGRLVGGWERRVCNADGRRNGGPNECACNEPDLVQMLRRIYLRFSTARQ